MDEIIKSGNHYLIKVKGNQPKLKSAIEAVLSKGHPTGSYRTQEQIRGRLEIRKTSLFGRDADFPEGWGEHQHAGPGTQVFHKQGRQT